jgi:hypothetical protein
LPLYQDRRAPILAKIVAAARRSADWYDAFGTHMQLTSWAFALAYIRRAGRLSPERLQTLAPVFAASVAAQGLSLEAAE